MRCVHYDSECGPICCVSPSPNQRVLATRVAIHHAVDAEACRQLTSVDPAVQPVSESQRVMALAARLGPVADRVRENGCLDIEAAVVALCAEGQNWVEALAREGRCSAR